jgi:uncharacterized protein YutE (UPF0331/DUF86 family)
LPRPIKVRLADIRAHYEALALLLEQTPKDRFVEEARRSDPAQLAARIYPLERAFEILVNYVSELNELGLEAAGRTPGDRSANLRLLVREDVISSARARIWRGILEARNELQHEYPDVRAGGTYDSAAALVDHLPVYLRNYVAWMRRLGFGNQRGKKSGP